MRAGAGAPPAWSAVLSTRVHDSCRAVLAFDRLLRGEVAALHTLFSSAPSQPSDAVVLCLGSELGLGALHLVSLEKELGHRHAEHGLHPDRRFVLRFG